MKILGFNIGGGDDRNADSIEIRGRNVSDVHDKMHELGSELPFGHHHHAEASYNEDGSGTEVIGIIGDAQQAADWAREEFDRTGKSIHAHKMNGWQSGHTADRDQEHDRNEQYKDNPLDDPTLYYDV